MARMPVNSAPPLGTICASDLKKSSKPLELAASFIGSYIDNDSQYPEIGRMSLRMLFCFWFVFCNWFLTWF